MSKLSDESFSAVRPSGAPVSLLPLALAVIWAGTAVPVYVASPMLDGRFWRADTADLLANVVLYMPLGVALRRCAWWRVLGIAAALSIGLECAQILYPDRFTAAADIAANVGGALLGLGLSALAGRPAAWGLDPITITGRVAAASAVLFVAAAVLLSVPGGRSDFSNWDPDCRVIVGDELTGDRPWMGEIDAVAVFDEALGSREVARLSATEPGTRLDEEVAALSPVLFSARPGRVDSIAGVPLLEAAEHERFFQTLVRSGRLTVVARFKTGKTRQWGPARIFGFSKSPYSQNFMFGQDGQDIIFRLRTPESPEGYYPQIRVHDVLHESRPTVAAATYDGYGVRVYVNGRPAARLNLSARGRLSPYFADAGLPLAAAFLGMLMGTVWVWAVWRWKRGMLAVWGATGGLMGGGIFLLGGGAGALPLFSAWVPVLGGWGGAVVGAAVDWRGPAYPEDAPKQRREAAAR